MSWENTKLSRRGLITAALGLAAASLAGCALEAEDSASQGDPAPEPAPAAPKDAASGSALVVYFSHQGHTRGVAEKIAERAGADLFEIVPATPYPEGMAGAASVAEDELEANARPAIEGGVENIADYETVFIGYPIWYGTAPMVVGTFLEAHDLAGKTVQPFCTSSYNTIDEGSLDFVRDLAPDSEVGEGCTANSDEALDAWLEGLGY